jgi:hypothetical protein
LNELSQKGGGHIISHREVFFDPFSRLAMVFGGQTDALNGLENVTTNVQAFFDRQMARR